MSARLAAAGARSTLLMLGALASVAATEVANAHPIHTTLTVVTFDKSGAQFMIRAFADDFSASVAQFVGKPVPADSVVSDADVLRYVEAQVAITSSSGAKIALRSCGVRRESGLYWVCLRAPGVSAGKGSTVRSMVLTELHRDQVNVVRVERPGGRRTLVFSKGSGASSL